MDDAEVVRGLERLRNLFRDRQGFVEWNGSTSDPLRQILALDQFHDERAHASAFFEAVDRRDVRVVQRRESLGFASEPGEPVGVFGERLRQDLERDIAIEFRVARPEYLPHPAFADRRGDLVGTESRAGYKDQSWRDYTGGAVPRGGDACRSMPEGVPAGGGAVFGWR